MNISPVHIAVVVLVVILIFGAPKLPMLARSLGQSLKIFKSEVKDLRGDDEPAKTEPGELTPDASKNDVPQAKKTADEQDPQTHGK